MIVAVPRPDAQLDDELVIEIRDATQITISRVGEP
jgi:hypothetical protein